MKGNIFHIKSPYLIDRTTSTIKVLGEENVKLTIVTNPLMTKNVDVQDRKNDLH